MQHKEQTCGHSGGWRGWEELREQYWKIHITVCKTDSSWEVVQHGELNQAFCDNLEGRDMVGVGRKAQEAGNMCGLGVMEYSLSKTHVFDTS